MNLPAPLTPISSGRHKALDRNTGRDRSALSYIFYQNWTLSLFPTAAHCEFCRVISPATRITATSRAKPSPRSDTAAIRHHKSHVTKSLKKVMVQRGKQFKCHQDCITTFMKRNRLIEKQQHFLTYNNIISFEINEMVMQQRCFRHCRADTDYLWN